MVKKLVSRKKIWETKLGFEDSSCWMNNRSDSLRLTDSGFRKGRTIVKFVELPSGEITLGELLLLDRNMDCPYYISNAHIHVVIGTRAFDIKVCGSVKLFINLRLMAGKTDAKRLSTDE